jgi:iron complex transport system ATP-binding protein
MSGLAACGVSVRLGCRVVLDGVDATLTPGRVTAVIGPNGSGKSTLLATLAGELAPFAGTVMLDGTRLASIRPIELARRRAVLAQTPELAFPFTVDETVRLGLAPGLPRGAADAIAARRLADVDLVGFGDRICAELSGGERQRVHLARVLAQLDAPPDGRSRYLFLDEPTASLDLAHQLATLRLARRFADEGGGVLAVLHDVNLAVMAADEIVALKAGRVLARGTPAEVVTDAVIGALFDVAVRVGAAPAAPFLLPHGARAIKDGR